ncbi:diacylglycerol/lipid kinase family protein [Acetobacter sp. UBA5411]|uniref:diacylglycerol/lipid kinase family protein n=1 Tax=Acetobacter sp. UBA5411 TaxID=1945905 RepID=UPI0025BC12F4|nr:diacylglycerol kinase family protein [Acetobacter sp. UBA5411]
MSVSISCATIIYNPTSGKRRFDLVQRLAQALRASNIATDLLETHYKGHGTHLARQLAEQGYEGCLVAAGGDGTIAEIATGLDGTNIPLALFPTGTANVLAMELGITGEIPQLVSLITTARTRWIWPGWLETDSDRFMFLQMAGVGFDGAVVHGVTPHTKRRFGKLAYVFQTYRQLLAYRFPDFALLVDGVPFSCKGVLVSKGRFYGGKFRLLSLSRQHETGFSVLLMNGNGPLTALRTAAALLFGRVEHLSCIRCLQASEISVNASPSIPIQSDGDARGMTPVRITSATHPMLVFC